MLDGVYVSQMDQVLFSAKQEQCDHFDGHQVVLV